MRYSLPMSRDLTAVAVVCSLLWAVSGVVVLAVALHEHVHHAEPHDHYDVIRTALHGHAHESSPDHDHELSTLVCTSRGSAAPHIQDTTSQSPHIGGSCEFSLWVGVSTEPSFLDVGPPPYVMHCVLLT